MSPRQKSGRRILAVFGLIVGMGTAAAADDQALPGIDPKVLADARAEGEVTVYTSQDADISNATAEAFKKAVPGIEVRLLRLASVELNSRISGEFNSSVYEDDLIIGSDARIFNGHEDWWKPLTPQMIPTMSALPAAAISPNWLTVIQSVSMIAINTSMLSDAEAPRVWTDLLKPEFKGKGLLVDPRNSSTYMTWLDFMDKFYGDDFLTKLKDQNFALVSAGAPGVQEIAAGGGEFAFPVGQAHINPVKAKGAPVAPVKPWENSDIPATGAETAVAISAHAKHPNAAEVYLSWFLTPAAQKINCAGAYASLALPANDLGPCLPYAQKFIEQQDISDDRRAHLLGLLGLN